MNPLKNKPYFTLDINGFGTKVLADVNGFNAYHSFDSQGQITTTLPINHMMSPDDNMITLIILPNSRGESINPSANMEITLKVAPKENREDSVPIASIKFEGHHSNPDLYIKNSSSSGKFDPSNGMREATDGTVIVEDIYHTEMPIYKGGIIYTRKFHTPNSLPRWAFFKSDELPTQFSLNVESERELREEIFPEYMKIHDALKNKKLDSIMPLFEERSREIDQAFYFTEGTTQAKLEFALSEALENPDYELVSLEPRMVSSHIERNNKLMSLKRKRSKAAIAFNDNANSSSETYDIIFRKQNGKWIISR